MDNRASARIHEPRDDGAAFDREFLQRVIEVQPIDADARAERVEQHGLQHTAVDRDLRPAVARGESAWLAPDRLATLRVVRKGFAAHARGIDRGREFELGQLANRVRQQVDADA
jgi:hypothetical protein